ncbi:MAG: Fur family transcriptional regulator [Desulfobacca sp.]|nr:Fur family transcriptional regulator [Desulfobacca sp.]
MTAARSAKRMEAALRAAGYRLTPQRAAILAYLAATGSHPSARQVYDEVRQTYPGLSLATVYNTLGILVKSGLLKVLEFELDNRYETNLTPHINLICTRCGKIQDLVAPLPISAEHLADKVGFQVLDYRMEYYGLCPDCQGRIKNRQSATKINKGEQYEQS